MIAVSDASPLHYLILIDEVRLLPAFFGSVWIPEAVFQELDDPLTPKEVRDWMSGPPTWLEMRAVTPNPLEELAKLDPGERETIQLAQEFSVRTVVIDETAGRRQAAKLNLEVIGTLGILERAANLDLIDFREALAKLERTSFRLSRRVRETFLMRNP